MALLQEQLSAAVKRLESQSSVELLVAVAKESDSYRDLSVAAGSVLGLAWLTFIIHSPFAFHPDLVVVLVAAAILIFSAAFDKVNWLKRRLLTKKRMDAEVKRGARACFHDHDMASTRDRTGILLYISELEGMVSFVVDLGVLAHLGRAPFNLWEHRLAKAGNRWTEELLECLSNLEEQCSKALPRKEDDEDEITATVVEC